VGATRADRLQKIFEKLEMTPGRFRIEWISAAEGDKYAHVINEMQDVIDSIPHDQLMQEIERLRPEMEKRARRMYETPGVAKAAEYSDEMTRIIISKEVKSGA
jgi:heterodisulfide reductase subunit A